MKPFSIPSSSTKTQAFPCMEWKRACNAWKNNLFAVFCENLAKLLTNRVFAAIMNTSKSKRSKIP
jgi:hypothetical protein